MVQYGQQDPSIKLKLCRSAHYGFTVASQIPARLRRGCVGKRNPLEFPNFVKFAVSGRVEATPCIDQDEVWQGTTRRRCSLAFEIAPCSVMSLDMGALSKKFKIWDV